MTATSSVMILTAIMRSIRAAMPLITFMLRMDVGTSKAANESSYKTPVAGLTGMNAKTYDTEAVP